jgi:cytochrome c oxidase subunit IV
VQDSTRKIFYTYAALMFLLVVTVLLSFVPFVSMGAWSAPVSLFVATLKASLVLVIFMKLKESSGSLRIIALGSLFWLFALLLLTGSDYLTRI